MSFWLSNNISKDTDFQELSESEFIFFWTRRPDKVTDKLLAKWLSKNIDLLPFWKNDRWLKLILVTTDIGHFVEKSLLHLLRSFSTQRDEKKGRENVKITSKYGKNHFFKFSRSNLKRWRIVIPRFFSQVRYKNLIFWMHKFRDMIFHFR